MYESADFDKACELIEQVASSFFRNDINESVDKLTSTFLSLMDDCIPKFTVKLGKTLLG